MEYIAVLYSYLEYSLDDNHTVNLFFQSTSSVHKILLHFLFFVSYELKPRLKYFFCILICAFIFVKQ